MGKMGINKNLLKEDEFVVNSKVSHGSEFLVDHAMCATSFPRSDMECMQGQEDLRYSVKVPTGNDLILNKFLFCGCLVS